MDENNIWQTGRSDINVDIDIDRIAQAAINQEPATLGDERRRSLVLAAYHLIAEGGLERLRTRDIAARAGMNIATLHYYFPGKEDVHCAIRTRAAFAARSGHPSYDSMVR
jgi:AcrR family transcriptional regulator